MPRPSSYDDLDSHVLRDTVATFDVSMFADNSEAMKAYGSFLQAIRAHTPIHVETHGGNVTMDRVKTEGELDKLLAEKQASWDRNQARYEMARDAYLQGEVLALAERWRDTEAWVLRAHAHREGLPVYDLIHENDSVRKEARQLAGL